mmetsp:Transcript_1911/g.7929  ORF Transcript_1911/g.7929 Transcript_1911/m.7929 type:complete len:225 (+) Transcript_1911:2677-3351(+)
MHRAASATAALEARRRRSANASATLFFSCTTFSNLSAISSIARVLVSKPLSNAAARAFVSRSETASASNASRRARSAETGDSASSTSSPAWSSRAAPNEFDARSVVGGVHGWSSELSPPEEPRELPGEVDSSGRRAAEYEASLSSLASSSSTARCFLGVMSSPGARSETRAAGWPPSSSGSPRTSPGAASRGDARALACGSSPVWVVTSSPAWTSTPSANLKPR